MLNFSSKKYIDKTILIVEDEKPLRTAVRKKLSREGFDVLEAVNGEEGLEMALKEKPDLILLDIVMPIMDGIKMLKKLREDMWGKKVEVIMLTNLSNAAKELESFQEGASDYLVKSDWKIADLIKKIKEKLNN